MGIWSLPRADRRRVAPSSRHENESPRSLRTGIVQGVERNLGEHLIRSLAVVQRDIDATAEEPHRMHFVPVPSGRDPSDDRIFLAIEDGSYWSWIFVLR
jgi:hypothetical protein